MTDKNTLKTIYSTAYNCFLSARNGNGFLLPSLCLNSYQAEAFLYQLQQPPETDTEFQQIYRSVYNLHLSALENGKDRNAWQRFNKSCCDLDTQYNGKARALISAMYEYIYLDTKQ